MSDGEREYVIVMGAEKGIRLSIYTHAAFVFLYGKYRYLTLKYYLTCVYLKCSSIEL